MRHLLAFLLVLVSAVGVGSPGLATASQADWALSAISLADARIRAEALLGSIAAGPITVAVLDSGVDALHPALTGRLWPAINAIPGTAGTADDSVDGHGTHVTGTVAMATAGFPVKILPIKVLGADSAGDLEELGRAIRLAVDWRGPGGERVRVINLSLGQRTGAQPATLAAAVRHAIDQGVVLVAAAGNEGRRVAGYYPAALPGVLSVAATDSGHLPDRASNAGALIYAPGVGVTSTVPGGGFGARSGSSFAAPFVSAGAAVLWSVFPELSRIEVMAALIGGHAPRPCPDGSCPVFSIDMALAHLGPLRAPTLHSPGRPLYRRRVLITGQSAPGAKVTVYGGGLPATATAGEDGAFGATLLLPEPGDYSLTAIADLGGVRSRVSLPVRIQRSVPGRPSLAWSQTGPLWLPALSQ